MGGGGPAPTRRPVPGRSRQGAGQALRRSAISACWLIDQRPYTRRPSAARSGVAVRAVKPGAFTGNAEPLGTASEGFKLSGGSAHDSPR